MLVLSRKLGESIVINEEIEIKIISIEKGVVKVGVEAPRSVSIVRSELLRDIKELNIAASKEVKEGELTLLSKILKR